jgi:C_GCAxxG_C_C family probable redox protein
VKKPEENLQEQAFKKAHDYLNAGWNCSQSTLLVMQELLGMENADVLKAATGFGGGIGNMGALCGAFAGGVLALGLKYGRSNLDQHDEKEKTYVLCAEWYKRFVRHFESCNCRDILGVDLSNPKIRQEYWNSGDNRERCATHTVGTAARMLMKLFEEIESSEGVNLE